MSRQQRIDEQFVEFVAASQRDLRRTAFLLCGDWQLSEDAVQTALFRVYLRWSRIEREGAVWSYARRAVINAVIDQRRRGWRSEIPVVEVPDFASSEDTASIDDRLLVWQGLATLPVKQRAVVTLRYVEDLDVVETARILRAPTGSITVWSARALTSLRQFLTTHGFVRGTRLEETT